MTNPITIFLCLLKIALFIYKHDKELILKFYADLYLNSNYLWMISIHKNIGSVYDLIVTEQWARLEPPYSLDTIDNYQWNKSMSKWENKR